MRNFYSQLNAVVVSKIVKCIEDYPTQFEHVLLNDSEYSDCKQFILEIKRRSSYYVKMFNLSFKDLAESIALGIKLPMGKCQRNLK